MKTIQMNTGYCNCHWVMVTTNVWKQENRVPFLISPNKAILQNKTFSVCEFCFGWNDMSRTILTEILPDRRIRSDCLPPLSLLWPPVSPLSRPPFFHPHIPAQCLADPCSTGCLTAADRQTGWELTSWNNYTRLSVCEKHLSSAFN